jgi:hypothetical protein
MTRFRVLFTPSAEAEAMLEKRTRPGENKIEIFDARNQHATRCSQIISDKIPGARLDAIGFAGTFVELPPDANVSEIMRIIQTECDGILDVGAPLDKTA